jgi:hypothetical protein
MSEFDLEDDEEPVQKSNSPGRRHHRKEAAEHRQLGLEARTPDQRYEHLYAANLHLGVAQSPSALTADYKLKGA